MSEEQDYQDYLDYQEYQRSSAGMMDSSPEGASFVDQLLNPYGGLAKSGAGLVEAAGDLVGYDISPYTQAVKQSVEQRDSRVRDSLGLDPGSVGSSLYDVGSFALQAPALFAGGGAGSTAQVLGRLAGQNFGERYGQFKQAGLSPADAGIDAGISTAANTALNAVPVGALYSKFGPVARTALASGTNALLNPLGAGIDIALEGQATGNVPSAEEIAATLLQSGMVGAVTPLAAAPFARPGTPESTRPNTDAMVEQFLSQPEAPPAPQRLALPAPDSVIYGEDLSTPQLALPQNVRLGLPAPESPVVRSGASSGDVIEAGGPPVAQLGLPPPLPGSLAMREAEILAGAGIVPKTSLAEAQLIDVKPRRPPVDKLLRAAAKQRPQKGLYVEEGNPRSPEFQDRLSQIRAEVQAQEAARQQAALGPSPILQPNPPTPASSIKSVFAPRAREVIDPVEAARLDQETAARALAEEMPTSEAERARRLLGSWSPRDVPELPSNKGTRINFGEIREADRGVWTIEKRAAAEADINDILDSPDPDKNRSLFNYMRQQLDDEGGSTVIPARVFGGAWDAVSKATQGLTDPTRGGQIKDNLAPSQKFFEGRLPNGKPLKGIAWANNKLTYMRTVGEKYAHAKPATDAMNHRFRDESFVQQEVSSMMSPFWNLENKSKVNEALITARKYSNQAKKRNAVSASTVPENLSIEQLQKAYDLNDTEVAAVKSVREAMRYSADKYLRELLLLKHPQSPDAVNAYVDHIISQDYIPFSRFGDEFELIADKTDTLPPHLQFFDSEKDAIKAKKSLEQTYGAGKVTLQRKTNMTVDAFEGLPRELLQGNGVFDPHKWTEIAKQGKPQRGFNKHLIEASLTPGFEKDLGRSVADYTSGLARAVARERMNQKVDTALSTIDGTKEPRLVEYLRRAQEDMNNPKHSALWDSARSFNTFYTLSAVPSTVATNLMQPLLSTAPQILKTTRSLGETTRIFGRAEKITSQIFTHRVADRAGGKKDGAKMSSYLKGLGELGTLIKEAEMEGIVEGQNIDFIRRFKYGEDQKRTPGNVFRSTTDALMTPFTLAESWNRYHALVSGYESGKFAGLKGKELFEFAKDFVDETQFIGNDAGRPELQRTPFGKTALQFKNFSGNYFRFLKKNLSEKEFKVVALSATAPMVLGGALAIPGFNYVVQALEGLGFDPKKEVREAIDNDFFSTLTTYGLPATAGTNISRNLQMGETIEAVDRDPFATIGRAVLGPTAEPLARTMKAKELYQRGETAAAVETLAPRFLRGPIKAARSAMYGELRDSRGKTLLDDPSIGELLQIASGFSPTRLTKEYDKRTTTIREEKASSTASEHWNLRAGKARGRGDIEALRQVEQEIRNYNQNLKPGQKPKKLDSATVSRIAKEYRPQSRGTYP